mmetsp:Transcript_34524/g.39342  ORF Transcript_34524/g.39342 Transcript_34524/m.39342 type:complete len:107 (-) Transcript_34524:108-428(-)
MTVDGIGVMTIDADLLLEAAIAMMTETMTDADRLLDIEDLPDLALDPLQGTDPEVHHAGMTTTDLDLEPTIEVEDLMIEVTEIVEIVAIVHKRQNFAFTQEMIVNT